MQCNWVVTLNFNVIQLNCLNICPWNHKLAVCGKNLEQEFLVASSRTSTGGGSVNTCPTGVTHTAAVKEPVFTGVLAVTLLE